MSWAPLEKLRDILAAEGAPIRVPKRRLLNAEDDVLLEVGQTVRFSTAHIDGRGKVLALDHGAVYPVKLQYSAPNGDSRITIFSPDEFMYLRVMP
jgi:sarcosine oxidase gamma subunit